MLHLTLRVPTFYRQRINVELALSEPSRTPQVKYQAGRSGDVIFAVSELFILILPETFWSFHMHRVSTCPVFTLLLVEAIEPPGDERNDALSLALWMWAYDRKCTTRNRAIVPLACRWKQLCIFH